MKMSYCSKRFSNPISRMSRNPRVVRNAVRAPLRSMRALVARVVPWTKTATSAGVIALSSSTVSSASKTPASGARGVVRTLAVRRPAGASRTTSVNVPPMSAATRTREPAPSVIARFRRRSVPCPVPIRRRLGRAGCYRCRFVPCKEPAGMKLMRPDTLATHHPPPLLPASDEWAAGCPRHAHPRDLPRPGPPRPARRLRGSVRPAPSPAAFTSTPTPWARCRWRHRSGSGG